MNDLEEFNQRVGAAAPVRRSGVPMEEIDIGHGKQGDIAARAKMWAVYGDTFSPCEQAVDKLAPAQYTIEFSHERGIFLKQRDAQLDGLLHLPDSASEEVIEGIRQFWGKEKNFRSFGFLWKRGVLLWGPAGSGKTSTLQFISKDIIERGGISVYADNPKLAAQGLSLIRKIEPQRPIVVMVEDIDAIIDEHGEASLLAMLDGELQIDNVVFIATTNYPERLDKRLTNRPSRFDIIKKIDMPNAEARKVYLSAKNSRLTEHELKRWVESTDGFSIAHMKELIVSVECFGNQVDATISRLKSMMNNISSTDNAKKAGFIS